MSALDIKHDLSTHVGRCARLEAIADARYAEEINGDEQYALHIAYAVECYSAETGRDLTAVEIATALSRLGVRDAA